MSRVFRVCVAALSLVVAALVLVSAGAASGVQIPQDRLVSTTPVSWTPNVVDGKVEAVVQMGNTMIVGGSFSTVEAAGSSTQLSRANILAFNATTGALSTTFQPQIDGEVMTLLPSADGQSVYVGGAFHTVNGVATKSLTELSLSNGSLVPAFKTPSVNGLVKDLRLSGGRLWAAGTFTKIGGEVQTGLATLDPSTGTVDPYMQLPITGVHNGGSTQVIKIDITPDGSRLVGIGNFTDVGGSPHEQAFMLDLTGATAQLANWQTNFYHGTCASVFDSYMRDLDISPDGSYVVISTTGAYNGYNSPCDETARWNIADSGSNLTPAWIDYTGGDTTYAVAVTGTAVYVGGHMRWENNPYAGDQAGQGAVPRQGIAALDPANGLPFSWNPGRARGVGVFDMLSTNAGLWVVSDTDRIGNFAYHGKIALLPLNGGEVVPPNTTGTLPGQVYLAGSQAPTNPNILYRVDAGGPQLGALDDGPNWAGDDSPPDPHHNAGSNTAAYSPSVTRDASVPASAPTALFDTERWDPNGDPEMNWSFPVPAGEHVDVHLFFANRYSGTSSPGQRVFDVAIDGTTVLNHYDIVADVGDQTGVMKSFPVSSDGSVDISFQHEVENPLIDGIEIVRTDGPPPPPPGNNDGVRKVSFTGSSVTADQQLPDTGIAWHSARGATMINGTVYYGYSDGQMYSRTFDGSSFGPAVAVDGMDQLIPLSVFHSDVSAMTSMFFQDGRLYYTLGGDPRLYYRYFTPESKVVGGLRYVASSGVSGIDFSQATGMFTTAGKLYMATSDGNLHRVDFTGGHPVDGTASIVSGPGVDGTSWTSKAMFLYAPAGGGQANQPPSAVASISCAQLSCTMSGDGSSDPEGFLTSYKWDFGDGATSTQADTSHVYAAAGTYTVTLTVTDAGGLSDTASKTVQVGAAAAGIGFVGAAGVHNNAARQSVQLPASVSAGDGLVMVATEASDAVTPTAPAGWRLVGTTTSSRTTSTVWQRVAAAGDAGSSVTMNYSAQVKAALSVFAYSGTSATSPVAAWQGVGETTSQSAHTTPTANVMVGGSWALSYWADNSSTTTSWTLPAGVTSRSAVCGSGGGHICATAADSGGPVSSTSYGGLTATADSPSAKAVMWTLILAAG